MDELQKKRWEAYEKAGLVPSKLIEFLWEWVVENRPEKAEQAQTEREKIKLRFPKKEKNTSRKVDLRWKLFRRERNIKLAKTDYTQLADAPLTSEKKTEYRKYRKFLRDLPKNYDNITIWDASVPEFEEWKEQWNK